MPAPEASGEDGTPPPPTWTCPVCQYDKLPCGSAGRRSHIRHRHRDYLNLEVVRSCPCRHGCTRCVPADVLAHGLPVEGSERSAAAAPAVAAAGATAASAPPLPPRAAQAAAPRVCSEAAGIREVVARVRAATAGLPQGFRLGVIYGPSGSGKSRLLAALSAKKPVSESIVAKQFKANMAVCSHPAFGDGGDAISLLSAAGLNKIPAWVRPLHSISNGERSRALLAVTLASASTALSIDDFASNTDAASAMSTARSLASLVKQRGLKSVWVATANRQVLPCLEADLVVLAQSGQAAPNPWPREERRAGVEWHMNVEGFREPEGQSPGTAAWVGDEFRGEVQDDREQVVAQALAGRTQRWSVAGGKRELRARVQVTESCRKVEEAFEYSFDGTSTTTLHQIQDLGVLVGPAGKKSRIIVLTGPSGSGKTSELRRLVAELGLRAAPDAPSWHREGPVKEQIAGTASEAEALLRAVALPEQCWLRPYRELSSGEQSRADIARRLSCGEGAIDEFTSSLDRATARRVCNGVAKFVRAKGRTLCVSTIWQDLWNEYIHETAFEVIRQKFDASSALRHQLQSTGDLVLAAAGHDDLVWGAGLGGGDERVQDPAQWRGQNVLGLALMRVRSQQRGQDSSLESARAAVERQAAAKGCELARRRASQEAPLPARPWARAGVLRALGGRAARAARGRLACAALGEGRGDEQRQSELLAGASIDGGGEVGGSAGSEDAWQVVDRQGTVLAEDDCLMPLTTGSVEAKMEMLLSWMLAPAVHGIAKLGVPSAADRAGELLAGRDVEAAVCEVVAGSERTVSTVVLNFCLERIPILGCPTVLLRSTWGNLRSILIIAALYGHDLEAPRTLHEALLCLVPPGEGSDAAAMRSRSLKEGPAQASIVAETAEKVARMLIRGALKKATGLEAAVDCFELASLLYSTCGQGVAEDEDGLGFVHVTATPASAARDFFRRRSLASTALLWCSLPLLTVGVASPLLLVLLRWASLALGPLRSLGQWVRRQPFETLPPMALLIVGLVLAFRAYLGIAGPGPFANVRRRARRCARRAVRGQKADMLRDAWPRVVTTAVFLLHGLLPACMTFSAVSMVSSAIEGPERAFGEAPDSWDALHRLACATLGVYSFLNVALRRLQGEDEVAPAGRLPLRIAMAVAQGCCVFAAWAYASLALDLAATRVSALMYDTPQAGVTALGVVGPLSRLLGVPGPAGASSPFRSTRAAAFCLNIVSVTSQQRLFELLGRREVLLRLIGAEHVTASTIVLLLRGVAVACSRGANVNVAEFLTRAAPPPACCVIIVALRSRAMLVGGALVLAPAVASGKFVGSGTSFCMGLLAGSYAAHTLLWVWYACREDMDSPALRLAMLVPGGASMRAKGLLRGALAGARTRAVQMMAMSIWERFATWFWASRL